MERSLHILLVEDDDTHAALVNRVFDKLLVSIDRVTDAIQATAYLWEKPPFTGRRRPDLMLLDLGLPGSSGHELLQRLKSDPAWADLVIVVLTSSTDPEDIRRAYCAYANSYLVKPLGYRELEEMLTSLVSYWSRWNTYLY